MHPVFMWQVINLWVSYGVISVVLVFLLHHSPCNVCHRLAFQSKPSSCLIVLPGWFPAGSQWRGSVLRTAAMPTTAPGSRFSPPWSAGRMDNLSKRAEEHASDIKVDVQTRVWRWKKSCFKSDWKSLSFIYLCGPLQLHSRNDYMSDVNDQHKEKQICQDYWAAR